MKRRSFLTLGAAGALGLLHGARRASADPLVQRDAPPNVQKDIPFGPSRLGLSDDFRDGTLYLPKSYRPGVPMPVLVMLHGYSGGAESVRYTFPLAEEFGVIVIAPESRDVTWGASVPGFDVDVRYIGAAFRYVTDVLDIDPDYVALGGQSDGATYALAMGLAYGSTFNHLMIFAEGMMAPLRKQGKPKIFIAHGINDEQMPIDRTSRRMVPDLKADGYDVTYREHEGGHGTPAAIIREGFQWFLADRKPR